MFAILQKYDFSSKSQRNFYSFGFLNVVCDTAKVRFFKQITTLFVKSSLIACCLRYCKSTIFQANHNQALAMVSTSLVVCDTAKVRFFKQITTNYLIETWHDELFAILQKYDFSSKSQRTHSQAVELKCCLRYCKSTIFQANHNRNFAYYC